MIRLVFRALWWILVTTFRIIVWITLAVIAFLAIRRLVRRAA